MTIPEKVQDFVGKLPSYSHLAPHTPWKGFDVYTVELERPMVVGYPQVILVKGEEIQWAEPDEALMIVLNDDDD